jgi:DNA repair exonuclease SbcCD nuclease subunit
MKSPPIRIVFFADTHLGFDYPLRPRVETRRRGQDFFDNFERILDYAASTGPDLVVHGGDLFFRSRVPHPIVDKVYDSLWRFAQTGIPILIVPGNHERSKLPTSIWLAHPNIHVFDTPKTYRVAVSRTSIAVSGFPFVRDDIRRRFKEVIAETGWDESSADIKLLCMHHFVEGAQVGPSGYTFRSGPDVVRMSDIPTDCVAVLAGHVHRKQVLRKTIGNDELQVIYPGSTERTSFAEKDEPKGFFDIEIDRGPAGTGWVTELEFHELPARPMFDLEIGAEVQASGLRGYLLDRIAKLDKNAVVRLACANQLDSATGAMLTASFLRSVFPSSMSFQLSINMRRGRQDELRDAAE